VATVKVKAVARPLKELVHLINDAINEAFHAAETAAAPHWLRVGQLLNEAKGQLDHGAFESWVKRNFNISNQQARTYMKVARTTLSTENASRLPLSLTAAQRQANPNARSYSKEGLPVRPQPWHHPVKEELKREIAFLHDENVKRTEERTIQRELALQLIDIGYRALSTKLHPDKPGGSREAMARLNTVRDRLKNSA
jgi:hypothetical protein